MKPLHDITKGYLRNDMPSFSIGDTVQLELKIIEGDKEKLQVFKGVVIARRGSGVDETFVVRKVSYSEGVERTFYLNSPIIKSLKVLRSGKVRRSKLYYLRDKIGKRAKIKELKKGAIILEEGALENVENNERTGEKQIQESS